MQSELKTCQAGSTKGVTGESAPQLVADKNEIIFSYDVLFRVGAADNPSLVLEPQMICLKILTPTPEK